jgi:predicted MFS family arabinose efflux permease
MSEADRSTGEADRPSSETSPPGPERAAGGTAQPGPERAAGETAQPGPERPSGGTAPPGPERALHQNRDYMLLTTGQVISRIGSASTSFVMPLIALSVTHSIIRAGVVGAATSVATVVATIPSGQIVDRRDRKQLLIIFCGFGAVLFFVAAVLAGTGGLGFPVLIAIGMLTGFTTTFIAIAETAAIRPMMAISQFGNAAAVRLARRQVAGIIGPPLGGLLLGVGLAVPFIADAASYAVAFAAAAALRTDLTPSKRPRRGFWRDVSDGMTWIWRYPAIQAILANSALINFALAGIQIVLILSLRSRGYPAAEIGLLGTATGISGLAGAVLSTTALKRVPTGRLVIVVSWILVGLALLLCIRLSLPPLLVLLAAVVFLIPTANAGVIGYQQAATPNDLQGRVSATTQLFIGCAAPLGPLLGAILLERYGSAVAFLVFAVVIAAAAASLTVSRHIRTIPLPSQWGNHLAPDTDTARLSTKAE